MKYLLIIISLFICFNCEAQKIRVPGQSVKVNPPKKYRNTQQTYEATCPVGSTGTPVTVTVLKNTYISYVSQADANSIALTKATQEAEAMLVCTATPTSFDNTEQSYTANCPVGTTGTPVEVIKTAGTYQSFISVADADSIALAAATQEAEAALVCSPTPTVYTNTEQSYTAQCPLGTVGDDVIVTKTAGTYTSFISIADANSLALAAATQEAEAALACLTVYENEEQIYTATCPNGYQGVAVTVTKSAGAYTSLVSVADANALALNAATAEANAAIVCTQIIYYNTPQTYTATCQPGYTGAQSTVTIEAGTYSSIVSIADANLKALNAATVAAQAALSCTIIPTTYVNTQQSYTANCPSGFTGTPQTVTKLAGTYTSNISVADANAKALSAATAEAQAALVCTAIPTIYSNTQQSFTANCPTGTTGPSVVVTKAAGTYTSTISQADANAKALAAATSEANAQLVCVTTAFNLAAYPALATTGPSGVSAPGDAFDFNAAATPAANTPIVGEWTRQGGPNNILAMTGILFRVSIADFSMAFYRTGVGVFNGVLETAQQTDKAAVRLPAQLLAWDFYVAWPKNNNGFGTPIKINSTETIWLESKGMVGQRMSIYGKNLAHNNIEGTSNSYVYLKPTGGGSGTYATVVSVTPYEVQYIMPSLANGTYNVYVHNGHGGSYNWSDPLVVTVQASTVEGKTSWGSNFTPSTNTFTAINTAVSAAGSSGNTILLSATTYTGAIQLSLNSNTRWLGTKNASGVPTTNITLSGNISSNSIGLFNNIAPTVVRFENINFITNGFNTGKQDYDGFNNYYTFQTFSGASQIMFYNCTIDGRGMGNFSLASCTGMYFTKTSLTGGGTQWNSTVYSEYANQFFVDSSKVYYTNDAEGAIGGKGFSETAITNSSFQDFNNATTDGSGWGKGRIFVTQGAGGSQYSFYFARNFGIGLGTRRSGTSQPDPNSGEIFLWEATGPIFTGSPTSSTTTTVTFGSTVPAYVANGGNRPIVMQVQQGKGLMITRRITSGWGTNTITLDRAIPFALDATSVVVIGNFNLRGVLYKNNLNANGKSYIANDAITNGTASSGVELYSGCSDFVVDGQITAGIRDGIVNQSLQITQNGSGSGNYFNLFQNLIITGSRYGVWTRAYPEPASNLYSGNYPYTPVGGMVYRNLSISGSLSFNFAYYVPFTNQSNGKSVGDLIIFENNKTTNAALNQSNQLNWARTEFGSIIATPKPSNSITNEVYYNNTQQ